jgi:hypothetical protein
MLNAFPVISNAAGILSRVIGFIGHNFMRILLGQGVQGLANNVTIWCALCDARARAYTDTHTLVRTRTHKHTPARTHVRTNTQTHARTHTQTHTQTQSFCKFLRLNFRWQCILPPSSPAIHDTLTSPVAYIHPYTLIPRHTLTRFQLFYICHKQTSPTRVHLLFIDFSIQFV